MDVGIDLLSHVPELCTQWQGGANTSVPQLAMALRSVA